MRLSAEGFSLDRHQSARCYARGAGPGPLMGAGPYGLEVHQLQLEPQASCVPGVLIASWGPCAGERPTRGAILNPRLLPPTEPGAAGVGTVRIAPAAGPAAKGLVQEQRSEID